MPLIEDITLDNVIDAARSENLSAEETARAVSGWRDKTSDYLAAQKLPPEKYFKGLEMIDEETAPLLGYAQQAAVAKWQRERLPQILPDENQQVGWANALKTNPPDPDNIAGHDWGEGMDPTAARQAYDEFGKLTANPVFARKRQADWQILASNDGAALARWRPFGKQVQVELPGAGTHRIDLPDITPADVETERGRTMETYNKLTEERRATGSLGSSAFGGRRPEVEVSRDLDSVEQRLRALEDPKAARSLLTTERLTTALKESPLAGKVGKEDLLQDIGKGLISGLANIRAGYNDLTGDTSERDSLRAWSKDFRKRYPGSTGREFRGGAGALVQQAAEGLGGMAPTVIPGAGVARIPGLGGTIAGRVLGMAPLAAQSYGGNIDKMLSDADAEEKAGRTKVAQMLRSNARSAATLGALSDVVTELWLPEEKMMVKAGGGVVRRVGANLVTIGAQNAAEEASAAALYNLIDPEFQGKAGPSVREAAAVGALAPAPLAARGIWQKNAAPPAPIPVTGEQAATYGTPDQLQLNAMSENHLANLQARADAGDTAAGEQLAEFARIRSEAQAPPAEAPPAQQTAPSTGAPRSTAPVSVPQGRLAALAAGQQAPAVAVPGMQNAAPVPSPPPAVHEQIRLTQEEASTRKAVLFTPGTQIPEERPAGLESVPTPHGEVWYNPAKISEEEVVAAGRGPVFDAAVLGMSGQAPGAGTQVVEASTPGAPGVQSEVVTPQGNVQAAVDAAQAAAPGAQVEVKPVDQVAAERAAQVPSEEELVAWAEEQDEGGANYYHGAAYQDTMAAEKEQKERALRLIAERWRAAQSAQSDARTSAAAAPADGRVGVTDKEAADALKILRANAPDLLKNLTVARNEPGRGGHVEGYHNENSGQSTVLLDNIVVRPGETAIGAVHRVIKHERRGHAPVTMLRAANPKKWDRTWGPLRAKIPDQELLDLIPLYPHLAEDEDGLAFEWLANKAQETDVSKAPPTSLVRRMWEAVKEAWAALNRGLKGVKGRTLDDELRNFLTQGKRALAKEQPATATAEGGTVRESRTLTIGARPGEYGWAPSNLVANQKQKAALEAELATLQQKPEENAARIAEVEQELRDIQAKLTPAPVTHPTQKKPRLERVGKAAQKILNKPSVRKLFDDLFGIANVDVKPTTGTWLGNLEPSFVLSAPGMTDEQAAKLGELMGFAWAQDATIVGRPNASLTEGIPAYFVGNKTPLRGKTLDIIVAESQKRGIDFATTPDGKSIQYLFFGEEADLPAFQQAVADIAAAAKLTEAGNELVSSDLNETQTNFSRSLREGAPPAWLQASPAGLATLERVVRDLVAPYAKAIGSEGYRFNIDFFAKRFGLNKEQAGVIADALYPTHGREKSAVPMMDGRITKEDLGIEGQWTQATPKKPSRFVASVTNVAWALQNWSAQRGLIAPGDYSPRAEKLIAQTIADEVEWHIKRAAELGKKSAIGWYDRALKAAKAVYGRMFSELAEGAGTYDPDKALVFDAILGITSQGNDVTANSIMETRVYANWRRGGKTVVEAAAPVTGTFGQKTVAIENNFAKLDELVKNNSYAELREFLNKKDTVANINARLRKDKKLWFNGAPLSVEGKATQKVTGWMVFGPKIGSFINNLHGDYTTLTADLWFSRTWNRILGWSFVHSPAREAENYLTMRDALVAEYTNDKSVRKIEKGKPVYWENGTDVTGMAPDAFDSLVNDPDQMMKLATKLEEEFRAGGYKDKSSLRRAAKTWIENRENVQEAPRSDYERDFQQSSMEGAQRMLAKKGMDVNIADMQAALWYNEKDLYAALGSSTKQAAPADYEAAAKTTYERIRAGTLYERAGKEAAAKKGGPALPSRMASPEFEAEIFKGINLPPLESAAQVAEEDAELEAPEAGIRESRGAPFEPRDWQGTPLPQWAKDRLGARSRAAFEVRQQALRAMLTGGKMPREFEQLAGRTQDEIRGFMAQGTARAGDLKKAMDDYAKRSGADPVLVGELVNGALEDPAQMAALPNDVLRERATAVRNYVDNGSAAIAATTGGTLGQEIMANTGHWLRRGYAAFDPSAGWDARSLRKAAAEGKKIAGKDAKTILDNARRYLEREHPNQSPAGIEAMISELLDRDSWQSAGLGIPRADGARVSREVSSFMTRQEIPAPIRELMGEEKNPIKRLGRSLGIQAQLIARFDQQRAMRNLGLQMGVFSTTRDGTYHVAVGGSDVEGNMRWNGFAYQDPVTGQVSPIYTTPEMQAAMRTAAATDAVNAGQLMLEAYKALGGIAKLNKVALNPDSWAVNLIGNILGLIQSGDMYSWRGWKNVAEAVRVHNSMDPHSGRAIDAVAEALKEQRRALLGQLVASGVAGASMEMRDLEAQLDNGVLQMIEGSQLKNRVVGTVRGIIGGQALGRAGGTVGQVIGGAVGGVAGLAAGSKRISAVEKRIAQIVLAAPDNIAKIAVYQGNLATQLAAGMTPEAAHTAAVEKTRATMPDYSRLPAFLRDLSKVGVLGSFIAFQHQVYMNYYHSAIFMAQELASGNKALFARGARRFMGVGTVTAMATGIIGQIVSSALGGAGDDKEKDKGYRRSLGAPWERFGQLAYTKLDKEGASFFNTSYLVPQTTLFELSKAAFEGKSFEEGLTNAVQAGWRQFAEGSVHADPLLEAVTNVRTGMRGNVSSEEGLRQIAERAMHVIKGTMEPGAANKAERLGMAARGEEKRGRQFTGQEELLRMVGVRQGSYRHEDRMRYRMQQLATTYSNARRDATRKWHDQPQSRPAAIARANERIDNSQALYDQFKADMKTLGISSSKVDAVRKDIRMPKFLRLRAGRAGPEVIPQ